MKNPLNLLIVEDNPNHIADLMGMLDRELPRLPIAVHYTIVPDLRQAESLLSAADAVMTDVFLPGVLGGDATEPIGKVIVERCLAEQKPVVWVTSTHHHGHATNAVNDWGRERGLEMFDCPSAGYDGEAPHKPWKNALYGLFYTMVAIEEGRCFFIGGKLMGPEYVDGRNQKSRKSFRCTPSTVDCFFSTEKLNSPVLQKMAELGFPRN